MTGPPAGSERFEAAISAIDSANSSDPNTVTFQGVERPKEQLHAELMTAWVLRLDPTADEAQLIAARAYHLRRWASPRSDEAPGRAGYLRWRTKLKERHAADVAAILESCGYDAATIDRVQRIIRKEGVKPGGKGNAEPEVQTHEDALCLVFLQTQLELVADDLGDAKTVEVLRKTAGKMSETGKAQALGLELGHRGRALLEEAVAET